MGNDAKRVFDGFTELSGGQDANSDPALLDVNESAFLGNISLRGNFAHTRPPYSRRILNFEDAQTESHFDGIFQGACFYEDSSDETQNSLIVSVGGRLFRIYVFNNFYVEEITAGPAELVTANFTVPAVGGSVTIDVTSETAFSVGDSIIIDGGSYIITGLAADQLTLTYNGGALNTGWIVPATTGVLDNSSNPIYATMPELVEAQFTVPAPAAQVTIGVSSSTGFTVNQVIIIDSGNYTVNTFGSGQIVATYNSGAAHATVNAATAIYQSNGTTPVTYQLLETTTYDFTVPPVGQSVSITVASETAFSPLQHIIIGGEHFTVNSIPATNVINATFTGGVLHVINGMSILDSNGNQIYYTDTNPSDALIVFLYQAENYVIGLCRNQATTIFDGSSVRRANMGAQELQSSYVGIYGWGRNWLAQVNGNRFVASDLVGDPSGSPGLNYVDAILKMTENNLLNGGGAFSIPANLGQITAMGVLAQLDSSLGIGPILVGTLNSIFSVQAPVDRTTWQNLTYPIQSVALQGSGPTGPRAMISVNSDSWFRSLDGFRSMMAARRDFQTNLSNTPSSMEMSPVFDTDDKGMLFYNSIAAFDNRILTTVSPYLTDYGVAHRGLAIVNQDEVSTMHKKSPTVWEGLWTGLNVFQVLSGNINGVPHCYAFVLNDTGNGIDLWELEREVDDDAYDTYSHITGGNLVVSRNPIASWIDTRAMNFGDSFQLKKLIMGELYLDEIVDSVAIKIYFKPDQYPLWTLWTTFGVCANVSQCTFAAGAGCVVWTTQFAQYGARLTLPRPPESCNNITGQLMDRGYEFQFRFEITGNCRIRKFKAHSVIEDMPMEGECPSTVTCKTLSGCAPSWFSYDAYP